ncbi:MAG: hypothetical protein LLF28_07925 [Nitrospiraceae bacterium]|nr:hypothetical protein [Nitrospiraceae bacterium]
MKETMEIGETISVIASFGMSDKIRPLRFEWGGRQIDITDITYMWETKEGKDKLYHFSVTDGETLYELVFDSCSLVWKIEQVEV